MKEIASFLCISERTVGRVLTERGVLPLKPKTVQISADAVRVMALLYKHKMTIDQLEDMFTAFPGFMAKAAQSAAGATEQLRSKKSPAGHVGKQTLLPLTFPSLTLGVQA